MKSDLNFPQPIKAEDFLKMKFLDPPTYGWQLKKSTLVLTYKKVMYEVDLERCLTSESVLDWIFQVRQKIWATPECMTGLLNLLDTILHPQVNLCSWGQRKILTNQDVKRLVREVESAESRGESATQE